MSKKWRKFRQRPVIITAYQDNEGGVIPANEMRPDIIVSPGDYIIQGMNGVEVVVAKKNFEQNYEPLLDYRPLVVVFFGETGPIKNHVAVRYAERLSGFCRVAVIGLLDFPKNIYELMQPGDDIDTAKYRRWVSRYYRQHPFRYLATMWVERVRSEIFDVVVVHDAHTAKEYEWCQANNWKKVLCDAGGDYFARFSFLERCARVMRRKKEGWDSVLKPNSYADWINNPDLDAQIEDLVKTTHGWLAEHCQKIEDMT